ncbi:unnamed protein product, partial [Ixodes hexagonus]
AGDRRSAVERLEASKAQYVKSERLLDCRQGGPAEAAAPPRTPESRSPSAYELVGRLRASPPGGPLQRTPSLRAPSPPMRARALSETAPRRLLRHSQRRSAHEDGRLELQLRRLIAPHGSAHKSLPDLSPSSARRTPVPAAERFPEPRVDYVGRSRSFRQCPAEPPRDVVRSPGRPVLRSKSDVAHRSQPELASLRPVPERFFESLGLDASAWRLLLSPPSPSTASRFFDSVSSVDSAVGGRCSSLGSGDDDAGSFGGLLHRADHAQTSIVEKNARVIKWLCNCRRAAGTVPS